MDGSLQGSVEPAAAGQEACSRPMPRVLAAEVLKSYADVLRVGRLTVNGTDLAWQTSTSNDDQLSDFAVVFTDALRGLVDESHLRQVTHWFCKSVSINYGLSEILALLQRRLGEPLGARCSVMTRSPSGAVMVDYSVDVVSARSMRVRVSWRGRDNIICCSPESAKKTVRGTLSSIETEFPIPPSQDFRPTYSVQMQLRGSRASELVRAVARSWYGSLPDPVELVSPDTPLRSAQGEADGSPNRPSRTLPRLFPCLLGRTAVGSAQMVEVPAPRKPSAAAAAEDLRGAGALVRTMSL